ncbi:hypothetical protein T4B_3994, partial [Trichinella pseudospiralis]
LAFEIAVIKMGVVNVKLTGEIVLDSLFLSSHLVHLFMDQCRGKHLSTDVNYDFGLIAEF